MFAQLFGGIAFVAAVRQVMIWAGIAVLSYSGIDAIMDSGVAAINDAYYNSLPADALAYMQLSGMPFLIKTVLSAHATVLSVQTFKRLGFKS